MHLKVEMHCPGMHSIVRKDLCQLSGFPFIHVFSQSRAHPSMLCPGTLVLGLCKLHFYFAGSSWFGSASNPLTLWGSVPGPMSPFSWRCQHRWPPQRSEFQHVPLPQSSVCVLSCSVVSDSLATPWTIAHQAPLCVGFPRGKIAGVGCHFLLQEIFPTQGFGTGRRVLYHWAAGNPAPTPCRIPAAAAKSLQSCLTLCDPIDSSPPGSLVPGTMSSFFLCSVNLRGQNCFLRLLP